MEEQTSLILKDLEKLESAVDRLISDKKVLSLELEARNGQIDGLKDAIKSSTADLGKVKKHITQLLLDKK